ncbi:hypothetical protein MDAP_001008 [Mitosporidium daphniae]
MTRSDSDECCLDLELENLSAENDSFFCEYRLRRLKELQQSVLKPVKDSSMPHYGYLHSAQNEAEVFEWTTKEPLVIIHFFLPSFKTCEVLDCHLKVFDLASIVLKETSGSSSNDPMGSYGCAGCALSDAKASNQGASMSGCIFKRYSDGQVFYFCTIDTGRIIGFDELGGTTAFTTGQLEKRISVSGIAEFAQSKAFLKRSPQTTTIDRTTTTALTETLTTKYKRQ